MRVNNKVIIVTGAGSGLGRALVFNLLAKGARIAAIDLNEATLSETIQMANANENNLKQYPLNITQKEGVTLTVNQVISDFGQVDGLINNAGIIQPFIRVNDLPFETIEKVMNVNFYGTLFLIKALLPHLLNRPVAHIVNISSMGGFLPVPGQTIYGASKAAVKLLTEGLYAELLDTPINVTVVFPGAIRTNISQNSGLKNIPNIEDMENSNQPILSPEEAAEIISNGMEKDKYRIIVGKDSWMMDLFYRLAPERAVKLITKKMKNLLS